MTKSFPAPFILMNRSMRFVYHRAASMPTVRWSELCHHPERSVAEAKDPVALPLSSRVGIPRLSLGMTVPFARLADRRHNRRNKFTDAVGQIVGVSNLSN